MPVTIATKRSSTSSSSTAYLQVCSVCKGEFSRRNDWLKHLTLDDHQKLARKECLNKWDSNLKKCCLIVYTSDPLTGHNAREIVDYFSRDVIGAMVLVTDFVWWEDRPHIGILQFESREKVKQILKTSGCQNSLKIRIGYYSQWIQVKNGVDLLELEWQGIRPPKQYSPVNQQGTKRKSDRLSQNQNLTNEQTVQLAANKNSPSQAKYNILEASKCSTSRQSKKIRTLDDNDNECTQTNSSQQNQVPEPLLPVAALNESPPFPWTSASHPLQFEYWTIRKSILLPEDPVPLRDPSQMDIQVGRLLDYMCQFDPRSDSLITMITYWTTINSINLAADANTEDLLELPPHFTIKSLVVFFLCHKSYIPAPRRFFAKDSDTNCLIDKFSGTNIGFHCDPGCVELWTTEKRNKQTHNSRIPEDEFSDEFLLNVFGLLWEFFLFYNSAFGGSQEQVGSTRDGKLINIKVLLQLENNKSKGCRRQLIRGKQMNSFEVDVLVNAIKREISSEEFCGIYITNPFIFSQKISLGKDIKTSLKYFSAGYGNIQSILAKVEQVGVKGAVGKLKKVLTIQKKLSNM